MKQDSILWPALLSIKFAKWLVAQVNKIQFICNLHDAGGKVTKRDIFLKDVLLAKEMTFF
jgi:hypothetical protein